MHKINKNFSDAREALKRLRISEQSDWYDWWFGIGHIKKSVRHYIFSFYRK
ncbi:MAG TPA: hypothetical protein VHJ38_08205 [Nitrososphaeraceae archaeon]|jgi:hypothetical protein|nr:hypothetical protein [Nitrososphaeraceae archaeon]